MDIEITDAIIVGRPNAPNVWALATTVTYDDGTTKRVAHVMPEDIFEWRVAEYDIDPDDRDTLLELVLYEPYLDNLSSDDPRLLINAESIATARTAHLERVRGKKGKGRVRTRNRRAPELAVTRAGPGERVLLDAVDDPLTPLEVLKREMPIDPGIVAVKRENVNRRRAAKKQGATPLRDVDFRRRPGVEEFREHLLGRKTRPGH